MCFDDLDLVNLDCLEADLIQYQPVAFRRVFFVSRDGSQPPNRPVDFFIQYLLNIAVTFKCDKRDPPHHVFGKGREFQY